MAALWFSVVVAVNLGDITQFASRLYVDRLDDGNVWVFISMLASQAVMLNAFLFIFNLLIPAYPMDGGRCMAALLILRGVEVTKAALITSVVAMAIALLMVGWAVLEFLFFDNGNSLLLALIGLYILSTSYGLYGRATTDNLSNDPLFGRACYQQGIPNNNNSGLSPSDNISTGVPSVQEVPSDIEVAPEKKGSWMPWSKTTTSPKENTTETPTIDMPTMEIA
jgi:hypothetical protein